MLHGKRHTIPLGRWLEYIACDGYRSFERRTPETDGVMEWILPLQAVTKNLVVNQEGGVHGTVTTHDGVVRSRAGWTEEYGLTVTVIEIDGSVHRHVHESVRVEVMQIDLGLTLLGGLPDSVAGACDAKTDGDIGIKGVARRASLGE